MSVTLTELISRVRVKADIEDSTHLTDSNITQFINNAIKSLYGTIIKTDEGYFVEDHTFSTTSDTQTYSLPSDFYTLLSVNAKINGSSIYRNVSKYNVGKRNRSSIFSSRFEYRLVGNNIKFVPTPQANTPILLEYTPKPTVLTSGSDTWSLEVFSEYIVTKAAISCLINEESDTLPLEKEFIQLKQDVIDLVYRDDAGPDSISDVLDNGFYDGEF